MQDLRKQDLAVGDTIVYAFAVGTSPYLRIGKILEFVDKKDKYSGRWTTKMKVEWQDTKSTYDPVTQVRGTEEYIWTSMVEFGYRALKL